MSAEEEAVPETINVAVLDERGRFMHCEHIAPDAFDPARHVHPDDFGGECDLPWGQYAWNAEHKRFESVEVNEVNERLAAQAELAAQWAKRGR